MALTLEELKEKLKTVDEVTLLEKLEIYSDDIVDRFSDKVEDCLEELLAEFEDEEEHE